NHCSENIGHHVWKELVMSSMHNRGVANPTAGSRTGERTERHEGLTAGLTETATQVKDKVQDFASSATHQLGEAWDATRSGAEEVCQDVASFIRRYPFAVTAAAFALGFLASQALSHWPT